MKVYNYSSAVVSVDGIVPTGQVFEIPEGFGGDLVVAGNTVSFADAPYSYISISDNGGSFDVLTPQVPAPPIWEMILLLVMLGGFALTVKIVQKVKGG